MGWFKEMQEYEDNGKRKGGRGLRWPTDLILGDEYLDTSRRTRADGRGTCWTTFGEFSTSCATGTATCRGARR